MLIHIAYNIGYMHKSIPIAKISTLKPTVAMDCETYRQDYVKVSIYYHSYLTKPLGR